MNCLYCYRLLDAGEQSFHAACSRKFFGDPIPPELPYTENDLSSLALEVIQTRTAVPGVQAKLSLNLRSGRSSNMPGRFAIVGLWGGFILKPPTPLYAQLPEVEDLTMHLAEAARIRTAPHSLIRMGSGSLAYITRRMDRTKKGRLAMEDMCQLSGKMMEDKYRGSYEQIARLILKYSATPGLDLVNFFEVVVFSFLTGNADMHLKNFSLLEQPGIGMTLAPAYDLVNTALVNPADQEEMALTLNGKKRKLDRQDFLLAMKGAGLEEKQQQNIFSKFRKSIPVWQEWIDASFLDESNKNRYKGLIQERFARMGG